MYIWHTKYTLEMFEVHRISQCLELAMPSPLSPFHLCIMRHFGPKQIYLVWNLSIRFSNVLRIWYWLNFENNNNKKTLPVQLEVLNCSFACIAVNENEAVLVKVQRCEESFIRTFVKGGSSPTFYRKCQEPIIQKCDAVRSLRVSSSLLTPCQCCSLGDGTVEILLLFFPQTDLWVP